MFGNCSGTSHDSRRPMVITARNNGIVSPPPTGTSSPFASSFMGVPEPGTGIMRMKKRRANALQCNNRARQVPMGTRNAVASVDFSGRVCAIDSEKSSPAASHFNAMFRSRPATTTGQSRLFIYRSRRGRSQSTSLFAAMTCTFLSSKTACVGGFVRPVRVRSPGSQRLLTNAANETAEAPDGGLPEDVLEAQWGRLWSRLRRARSRTAHLSQRHGRWAGACS